jgi:Zonular occludens toxin (Zot)
MSIFGYVGLPGSGKSYNVVAHVILPALREGRRVVTNVPVYHDKVYELLAKEKVANPGVIVDFPISEVSQEPELIKKYVLPGDVFVLDEVWRLWPSGMKANEIPEVYKSLLAEHRHMVDAAGRSCHIVLVVQDLANIAVFARRLVEQTFLHTKMGHMGQQGRFRVDIYQASMTGVIGPVKQRLRESYGSYSADVWDLYKSHTLTEAKTSGANEKAIDKRGNILRSPMIMYGLPAVVLAMIGACYVLSKHIDQMTHPPAPPKGVPSAAHPGFIDTTRQPPSGNFVGNLSLPVSRSADWRVVGSIEVPGDPGRSRAILQGPTGKTLSRSMTHCRYVDNDFLECELDGVWYGTAGASLVAHVATAIPVTLPGGPPLNSPISGPHPVVSVANEGRAPDSPVLGKGFPAQVPGVAEANGPTGIAFDPVPISQDPVTGIVGYDRAAWLARHSQ